MIQKHKDNYIFMKIGKFCKIIVKEKCPKFAKQYSNYNAVIITTKQLGKAHDRFKMKRIFKEAIRKTYTTEQNNFVYNFVCFHGAFGYNIDVIQEDIQNILNTFTKHKKNLDFNHR